MTQRVPVRPTSFRARRAPALRALVAVAAVALSAVPCAASRRTIMIYGSDTMVNLNRELVGEYMRRAGGARLEVHGGGSETGIAALLAGETDIAASSRAIRHHEVEAFERAHGGRPREVVIALDGLGIYVHSNNPVSSLTVDQVARIMSGEIGNWRDVGGFNRRIEVFTRNRDSGTRTYMETHVLLGKPFAPQAREVATTGLLAASVARTQGGIGYGGIAYVQGADIIRISPRPGEPAVWPSRENVSSGAYPLSRPLYYYLNPVSIDEDLESFIDWVLDTDGQRVVTFVGYYPAPKRRNEPADPNAPIVLTPRTMATHGFDLAMTVEDGDDADHPDHAAIRLRVDPGRGARRVRSVSLRLGEDAEVPLALDGRGEARFTLRRALIASTAVRLVTAAEEGDAPVYVARLADYLLR